MVEHLSTWMNTKITPDCPILFPSKPTFIQDFLSTTGNPNKKAHTSLTKTMGFGYRNGIDELI